MLMTLSHIAFNISLDLIYGKCYPLHAKTTSFHFTCVLVIVNPIIVVLVLKNTLYEVRVVNVFLKLIGNSQVMNYFKF